MEQRKQSGKIKNFTIKMQAKLVLVFCIIMLFFLAVMGRLIYLNYAKGTGYAKKVLSQQTYVSSVIPYRRGDITDRKGTLFATSEKVYNLIIEPKTILSKEEYYKEPTFSTLMEVFGFSREELNQILIDRPSSQYVVIKKEVTYEEKCAFEEAAAARAAQIKKNYVQGVWFEAQYRRDYPLGTVASDLIGFTSAGNVGNWGVEGYYNDSLNGTNGREYGYFDSELNLEDIVKDAVNGYNVTTTLDADAQRAVENIIAEYQEREGAENVGVIVMNPDTGEIYVMASDKGYDLRNPWDLSGYYTEAEIDAMSEEEQLNALNGIWRNYCISDSFEPGSTFKPFTVSSCLEQGIVGKYQNFICDGHEEIGGRRMHCVKRTGHGDLSLKESLMVSCNDVMMQISAALGRTEFNRYQRLFGMGNRTGIDLQGEGFGLIFTEEQLNPQELATSSFGQGLTVTMIQMVSGFSSLVNGGYYYQPHIMKELTTDAGLTVEEYKPTLMKKTVTKETSDFIREALLATVEEGSAKKAQAAGYQVGGKTGTAQKHPRTDENYVVSFIGFTPYENPEAVVYVVIDQPHVEDQTKCTSATEMASRVISEVLPILGIYPTEPIEKPEEPEGGEAGTVGEAGNAGENSEAGTTGETGNAGENGETGTVGDTGNAGENGEAGTDGNAGENTGEAGTAGGAENENTADGADGSETDGENAGDGAIPDEEENADATHGFD